MNIKRYKKQLLVKEFGKKEQNILKHSTVVIIGAGGLGSNSANILTRTGLGTIEIVDDDIVDITNLHRTSIFDEDDIGKPKSAILEEKLKKINSSICIKGIKARIEKENIDQIIKNADIILDGADNMKTRFLINDFSIKNNIPWVYAGVDSTVGMVMGIVPKKTPCLRCISQNIPSTPNNSEIGTFSVLPIIAASIQCMEAIKMLLGEKTTGLLIYNIWKQQFETMNLKRNPDCICCGKQTFDFLQR